MKKFLFLTTLFALLISAEAKFKFAPASIERYSHLQFTWWGFKVYKAEIWTPKAQKPDFKDKIILHINYQRDIKSDKLISSTRDEWKRLKLIRPESEIWLLRLARIWPDIKKGDSLTTYINGNKTSFYQGDKLLGEVIDKNFGSTFIQIWLHKKSQTSELLQRVK